MCSEVQPLFVWASTWTPLSSRTAAMPVWPAQAAMCNGVQPSSVFASIWASLASRTFTTPACPARVPQPVMYNKVQPSSVFASIWALLKSRAAATPTWPVRAAMCNGVQLSKGCTFVEIPWLISGFGGYSAWACIGMFGLGLYDSAEFLGPERHVGSEHRPQLDFVQSWRGR